VLHLIKKNGCFHTGPDAHLGETGKTK